MRMGMMDCLMMRIRRRRIRCAEADSAEYGEERGSSLHASERAGRIITIFYTAWSERAA